MRALLLCGCLLATAGRAGSASAAEQERQHESRYPVGRGFALAQTVRGAPTTLSPVALEELLRLRPRLENDAWIASLLGEATAEHLNLPGETMPAWHYLRGIVALRDGKLEEALRLLETVPPTATVYGKARYLLGVVVSDARRPGGATPEVALRRFAEVLALRDRRQEGLARVQALARLGMGRIYYALGEYTLASHAFEAVPRFSRFWGEALLENAFARFRRDDLGGALGSLETLHAPQFEGAFEPESWILKASVFYFSCLHAEAQAAVQAFEQLYGPVPQQLERYVATEPLAPEAYISAIDDDHSKLPNGLRRWVRHQEGVADALRLRREAQEEAKRAQQQGNPEAALAAREAEANLTRFAATQIRLRLEEARGEVRRLSDQADVVRVETAKADKELVQANVDQVALLARQRLYRPPTPPGAEYWQFDGEYWLDELGYYQYTLKRGCPARAEEKARARQ